MTFFLVFSWTSGLLFKARETVMADSPSFLAMSRMVALFLAGLTIYSP
jgi:hypothetical protein